VKILLAQQLSHEGAKNFCREAGLTLVSLDSVNELASEVLPTLRDCGKSKRSLIDNRAFVSTLRHLLRMPTIVTFFIDRFAHAQTFFAFFFLCQRTILFIK
jgi:hypothetical protein